VRAVKAVWQHYHPSEEMLWLLEQFRRMLNDCIRIGLTENVTSLKSLSLKAYKQLSSYEVLSCYKLCAISKAIGILKNYRKAKRKGKQVKEPHVRRLQLVTCYGLKINDGVIYLPFKSKQPVQIQLNHHTQEVLSEQDLTVRSITLTADRLSIAYAKEIIEIQPKGFVGIDRNLDNLTLADSSGRTEQFNLAKATEIKSRYRMVKAQFVRNDVRMRKRIFQKYGVKQRNKVGHILHNVSKHIVEDAKARSFGIVMEDLKGIRKLYRRGNWQGKKYRARMNGWSFRELQRQIEYKTRWEGLPVIFVRSHSTTSKCSVCGHRLKPEENRAMKCRNCGLTVDRDVNAARNILALGLRFRPVAQPLEAMVAEPQPERNPQSRWL
jgi:putative transposase